MSVWQTVLRLELRLLRRERATLMILGFFAACLVLAAICSGRHAAQIEAGMRRSESAEHARFEKARRDLVTLTKSGQALRSKDPRNTQYMGREGASRVAALPPAPLVAMAVGLRDLEPQALQVTTGIALASDGESETPMIGPTRLATGPFDPAFLFVYLFPLVVIALSYDLLAGERERGTMAMLLSQPVTQKQLLLGKAAGRAVVVAGVTVVSSLFAAVLAGAKLLSLAAWVHLGLFMLTVLSWALLWFAAAALVNAVGRSSAVNALSLVGAWLLVVIVLPGVLQACVDALHPPPSRVEFLHELREASQAGEQELVALQGRHDIDQSKTDYATRVTAMQKRLASTVRPLQEEMAARQAERESLTGVLQFLSPAMAVQLAIEDIAGSGIRRHARFTAQVTDFHTTYRDYFFTRIEQQRQFQARDIDGVPKFRFVEESTSSLMVRAGIGAIWSMVLALILIALSLPRLREIGRLS